MNDKNNAARDPVIVAARRTAVGKAKKGALATVRPDELAAAVIQDILQRTPQLDPAEVEDVILGCAFPEGEQGLNMARTVILRSDLPVSVPGQTVNRFCSSGVQTIAQGAMAILSGFQDIVIAGGVESMSMVPMTGNKYAPNPQSVHDHPEENVSMGITAENVADEYHVSREDQDTFAYRSHMKAAEALEKGVFDEEIVPIEVEVVEVGEDGKAYKHTYVHKVDEGVRTDTSVESLGKLRPAFKQTGTVTAGNSSQMNDGAAAVLLMSRAKAEELGLKPLARFVAYAVGGVRPEVMGIGPTAAVPKVLEKAGLTLDDIDLIELNEAFASQSLAVIRELGLDEEKVNVNGGAIALGHPLGATGAKLTVQLLYELKRRGGKYGMVTMCIGGGMGAAAIFENLQ